MASPVGTSFLDHFAALRDPRQGWKVVFPLSDDEAPRLEAPAEIDITTVILARKQPVGLGPATCVASEPETWTAFAILSGISSEALAGEQILIDQNAWLRAAWRPGEPGNLTNPQALAAVVRDIAPHPIAADAASSLLHCYDEPETLPSSIQPRCLIGADAEHIGHRIVMPRQPATDRNYASNTSRG